MCGVFIQKSDCGLFARTSQNKRDQKRDENMTELERERLDEIKKHIDAIEPVYTPGEVERQRDLALDYPIEVPVSSGDLKTTLRRVRSLITITNTLFILT